MRKHIYLLSFLTAFLFQLNVQAQCPGCHIDTTLTAPGIYPTTLPNGTQGVPYSSDVTFVMFTDTSGFAVNYFKINGVSGLPFGLHWECNNSATGCIYDPNVNIRGCVKICGTPLQTGSFPITVDIVVNLATVGNQNSSVVLNIQIDPGAGGNSGFTFSPAISCDSSQVTFNGIITGDPNPTTYAWDFGNGQTSTLQNPPVQSYSAPGDYVVTLVTNILGYQITDVNLFGVNNNWSGDVEEPSTTFFSPDPYFVITNSLSSTLYTAASLSNTTSGAWHGLTIPLSDPPYSIGIWDEDNVSADDNLGAFPFTVSGPGTIPFSGAGGTSGNLVVGTYVIQSFTNYDTVHVLAPPAPGTVSLAGSDTICHGDSVLLSVAGTAGCSVQWYSDTTLLVNADTNFYMVHETGNYWALLTNVNGCTSNSNTVPVFVAPNPLNPTFLYTVDTLTCFSTGYDLQWCLNGVPIPGATGSQYVIDQSGSYSVIATNAFGCSSHSISVLINFVGIEEQQDNVGLSVYPNPSNGTFTFSTTRAMHHVLYTVSDQLGRTVASGYLEGNSQEVHLEGLETGLYFLRVSGRNQVTKLVKE